MKSIPSLVAICAFLSMPMFVCAQDAPVDWKTLATEFSKNEAAAQAKYQGKMLTVVGPVSSIAGGDMTLDDPSVAVMLSTTDGPGPDVKCLFEPEDLEPNTEIHITGDNSEAQLRNLSPSGELLSSRPMMQIGQALTVAGTFLGYQAGDIVLRHCRLSGGAGR